MAFGREVYVNSSYTVVLFDSLYHGSLGINRDDHVHGIQHPIHVGTNTANGTGAHLTAGGTWSSKSSRTVKENFQPIDGRELLSKIDALAIESWNYRNSDERHIGPVSEDFVAAFDVGTTRGDSTRDDEHLSGMDVGGVALVAIKELISENRKLQSVIGQLEQRISELEAR